MSEELITMIIKIIVAILSVIITSVVVPYVKSKVDSTKYNDFMILVEKCVEAANQIYTPEQWSQKKQYVLKITENYCVEHGVNITAPEIDAIIEGFVILCKGE